MTIRLHDTRALVFDGDDFVGTFFLNGRTIDFRPRIFNPIVPEWEVWEEALKVLCPKA